MANKKGILSSFISNISALYTGEVVTQPDPTQSSSVRTKAIQTGSNSYFTEKYNVNVLGNINKIVNTAAQSEIVLKKEGKIQRNKFANKLKYRISRSETVDKFLREVLTHYHLYGNAYAYIVDDKNSYGMDAFERLSIIHPTKIETYHDPKTDELVYKINDSNFPDDKVISQHRMIHLKNVNVDGLKGINLIEQILGTLTIQQNLDKSLIKRLAKKIQSFAVKNKIETVIDPDDPEKIALEENYRDMVLQLKESENSDSSILIYHDDEMEITNIDTNPYMFDPTAYEKLVKERLEGIQNLPGGFSSINVGTTGYREAYNAFLQQTINPLLSMLSRELTRKLLTEEELEEGYIIEFTKIFTLTVEELTKHQRSGNLTIREIRTYYGYETGEGEELDAHWISGDLKPAKEQYINPNGTKTQDTLLLTDT